MGRFRKTSYTQRERFNGQHRFEHWYRDNTIYFITSKARDGAHVFKQEQAKQIFWDRFNHWTTQYDFKPFITSLMSNHYHTVGYLSVGENLGPIMQKMHGSVAKLVNDTLQLRHLPFWRTNGNRDYFDGCLRDENQLRRTYRYIQFQSTRAGVAGDWTSYRHTIAPMSIADALSLARNHRAYLPGVPYARYDGRTNGA